MRIRMAVTISGTRNGVAWPRRGEAIDLPDGEAAALCAQRLATPVREPRVERAVEDVVDVEERAEPAPARRKGGRPKLPRDEHGKVIRD